MSRKLISLVSTHGKSTEQVVKEVWDAFVHYRATELGLTKCDVCGGYMGIATDDGKEIKIRCNCSDILCTSCGLTKIPRPLSNLFSKDDAKIWHVPYFQHICSNCRKK